MAVCQHTQDVCGYLCVSVCVRQHTQDVRGSPSVHKSARWSLDSARWPFPWTVWVILTHVGSLFSTHRTSVGVCQHTHDVCGCPCVSVCVCLCPSAHTRRLWLFVCVHRHTHDVCGCPSSHTGRPCVSVRTHMTSMAVLVCPCVSVCVRQHTQDVCGYASVHISARWSLE